MMKEILIFLAGGACGAGVAYFLTKSKCEKACQEDINEIKESYSDKVKATADKVLKDISEPEKTEEKKVTKSETDYISKDIEEDHIVSGNKVRGLDKSHINTSKTNYSKITKPNKRTKTKGDDEMVIFEISEEKFTKIADDVEEGTGEYKNYQTASVLYSRDNQALFAENGMQIDKNLIGDDILTSMEANCEEGDYIYCENASKKMAFEICFSE